MTRARSAIPAAPGARAARAALRVTAILPALLAGGCAPWVELSDAGERVRQVEEPEAAACQRLGRTTVKGVDKVLAAKRLEHVVTRELRDMARNEAAALGGDTIVALTPVEEGKQTFGVYRCLEE